MSNHGRHGVKISGALIHNDKVGPIYESKVVLLFKYPRGPTQSLIYGSESPHLTRFSSRAPFEKVIFAVDLNYITVTYTGGEK